MTDRIVTLIDMDCFYCQVETRMDPTLAGIPMAVVQYKDWKGGGIIAVNYEARAFGVTRNMRGDDAKDKCPDIKLVKVPEVRGKADLTKYRDAGREVIEVLLSFEGVIIERASVDEAYLDLTQLVEKRMKYDFKLEDELPNTHVGKSGDLRTWLQDVRDREDDVRLAVGATIVEEMRSAVYKKTRFRCSAGIAHNKMLSKLACGFHKPNKQTILPQTMLPELFKDLKVTKLRGLGGKLGDSLRENLHCQTVDDLSQLTISQMKEFYDEKTARWLYDIARGLDHEPVKERDLPKSIGCGKNFRGPEMLGTRQKVEYWVGQLCEELVERLKKDKEANKRLARSFHISVSVEGKGHVSRMSPLTMNEYSAPAIIKQALALISKLNEATDPSSWTPKLRNVSVSASKFDEASKYATSSIANFFSKSMGREDKVVQEVQEVPEPSTSAAAVVHDENSVDSVDSLANQGDDASADEEPEEEELARCEKCGKLISPFELPEHYDFHTAQELYEDLKKQDLQERKISTFKVKPTKRKNGSNQGQESAIKKQRNIMSFFGKKS